MAETFTLEVDGQGKIALPLAVRDAAGIDSGSLLTLFARDEGLVLMTREQLRASVRLQLSGSDLVGSLIADRRRSAAAEDDR